MAAGPGAEGAGVWRPHRDRFTPSSTPWGKGWIISFINQSPVVLDNSAKDQATKNIFVTNMGDRRKLKAWFSTPPVLSFLLSILLFVVTPLYPFFCLFSLQASLLPCDSPSFTLSLCCHLSSLVFSENRCQMRKLLDVQLLRRFWLGIAQAGRFLKSCVTRGVLSRGFELALKCSRI